MITDRVRRARTVFVCLKEAAHFLESRGVPEARISAEALLSFVLKARRGLYLEPDFEIDPRHEEHLRNLLRKRAERYPLQYLLGEVPFRSAILSVGEGCLIPRPETEVLVDVVLRQVHSVFAPSPLPSPPNGGRGEGEGGILDVGTGSGNIAVSLAQELPFCKITATDISEAALEFAQKNADRSGVSGRIHFVQTDLWAGIKGKFDILVSNPPYLSENNFLNLQPEVTFEPRVALDGGADGLACIRRIIQGAREILKPGGFIALEVGMGQAEAVSAELILSGFDSIRIQKDFCGIDRIILGRLGEHG